MAIRTAKIRNKAGIHARPSGVIFKSFRASNHDIRLENKGHTADLKSVMGLIALGLVYEDEVIVTVSGPDEENVADRLVELLEKKYDFPPRA